MTGSKRCRVIVAYGMYSVGDIVWPTGAYRDHLLRNGYITLLPEPEMEVAEPVRETALRRRRSKRWDR